MFHLKNPIILILVHFDKWPYLCVDVITNQNVIGNSYIGPYLKEYLPAIASSIKSALQIMNKNYRTIFFLSKLHEIFILVGFKGIPLYGLAALDIAFWDAFGKII